MLRHLLDKMEACRTIGAGEGKHTITTRFRDF